MMSPVEAVMRMAPTGGPLKEGDPIRFPDNYAGDARLDGSLTGFFAPMHSRDPPDLGWFYI